MYKTPTFAEPQQYNRPFSTGQLSAFIIQLVIWHVLPRSERKNKISCNKNPSDDVGHSSMLASVELKKRENRDDLDFFTNERLRTLWYIYIYISVGKQTH
jgi:hypothetical protein